MSVDIPKFGTFCVTAGLLPLDHNDTDTETVPEGMVLIPEGEFQMGSEKGDRDEKPLHSVYLDVFYMDTHEVTAGEYKQFINATGHRALSDSVFRCSPTDKHPIVGVRVSVLRTDLVKNLRS